MRVSRAIWALLACSALTGCAHNRQYFRPTERVHGQTVHGYYEAFYDLAGAKGRFGEAKVWSIGAYRRGDTSVIEATLELHNTSDRPIEVHARDLRLDPLRLGNRTLRNLAAAETGTYRVGPGQRASLQLHFVLPDRVLPGEVTSFGLSWRVDNGEQTYAQLTPFREESAFYPPYERDYLYYGRTYPCSPYDTRCIGFYDDWPYSGPRYYTPPPAPPPSNRRRVDVK